MKAIRIHETGGPDVLRYEDVTEPQPRAGEALVRLKVRIAREYPLGKILLVP